MDQAKTDKIRDALEWVLTKCEQLHRHELNGSTYVGQRSMFRHLFDGGVLNPDDDYQDLSEYLDNYRAFHDLGEVVEFSPPEVPYSFAGTFYRQVEMPTSESIVHAFLEMLSDRDGRLRPTMCRDRVEKKVYFSTVVSNLIRYFGGGNDPETHQTYQAMIKTAIEDGTDWKLDQYQSELSVPLTMTTGSTPSLDKLLVHGGPVIEAALFNRLAMDVYGSRASYYFVRSDNKFSNEFLAYADKIAGEHGLVLVDGVYEDKPMVLPDNIKELGEQILSNADDLQTGEYGYQVFPLFTMKQRLASLDVTLNDTQIEKQLFGKQGEWREALVENGFHMDIARWSASNYPDYSQANRLFNGVSKLRRMSDGTDGDAIVEFAAGFPVVADGVVLDSTEHKLVYLSMIGDRTAVRANWSKLMEYNSYMSFRQTSFKVGSSHHHRIFRTKLPSGMWQIVMVHHDALPGKLDPLTPSAYILSLKDYSDKMPPGFTDYLDLLLHTPVLPEWGDRLWMLGRVIGLIEYASEPNSQIGATVWKIRNLHESWNELISANVASKDLVF